MKALVNIGVPPGMKVMRIQRQERKEIDRGRAGEITIDGFWIVWLHTKDYIHGTYLKMHDDGKIEQVTIRADEPCPDVALIKPRDQS